MLAVINCWPARNVPAARPLYPLYGSQPLLVVMTKTSVMFPTSLFFARHSGSRLVTVHKPTGGTNIENGNPSSQSILVKHLVHISVCILECIMKRF